MTISRNTLKFIQRQLRSGQFQRGELTMKRIAKRSGVSGATVTKIAWKMGVIKAKGSQDLLPTDPTLEEIKERSAEIRKEWSEEEHLLRAGIRPTRVEIQEIS